MSSATTAHIPGTLYPLGGRPHLPTMCRHRTGIRRGYRSVTVLCYEHGEYEMVRPDGTASHIETAEGPMPFRFCAKHQRAVEQSYRGVTWRRVQEQPAIAKAEGR